MYGHWRKQTSVVQDVAAFRHTLLNETSGTTPEQIRASRVSADYFRPFGASVYRGRTFSEQEDRSGGDAVAVVSHRLWTRRFGGVEVIGQALRLNGERYTIIGVLALDFRADDLGVEPDAIVRRGLEAIAAVPGLAVAGASCGLPLEDGFGLPFEIVGRPLPEGQRFHGGAAWLAVFPGYFETLRVLVKRGRSFTAADVRQNPAVAIVNDVMARQYWPAEDPIGKRLVMGHGTGPQFQDEPVREIVGVVGSVRTGRLADRPGAEMYLPQAQLPDVANAFVASGTPTAWIVRTTTAPEPLARTVQQTLQQALGLPVLNVRSMDEIVLRSILQQRLSMWLMAGFRCGGAARRHDRTLWTRGARGRAANA